MKVTHFLPILSLLMYSGSSNEYMTEDSGCPGNNCQISEDEGPCFDDGKSKLYRWDPVKIGHVRNLRLEGNQTHRMITRAIHPPVFEIPDFLSSDECDHIVNLAVKAGMLSSETLLDPLNVEHLKSMKSTEGHSNSSAGYFRFWDIDKDYEITREEVKMFAETYKYLILEDEDIDEMIKKLDLKEMEDGIIDYAEWQNVQKRTKVIDTYLNDLKQYHPHHRDRYSEQVWLLQGRYSDNTMRALRKRIWKLTKLPKEIVYGGEYLQKTRDIFIKCYTDMIRLNCAASGGLGRCYQRSQPVKSNNKVVRYDKRGHYNAHYDSARRSDFSQAKCCHLKSMDDGSFCRVCRYITVLYYLNDVEEGGETAFPVADLENFNETEYRDRRKGDLYNLSKYCHSANLVVPPKKGKAIMWYNFLQDEKTGWMGPRDDRSLHGGCDVKKGQKFVANNWLTAPEADSAHLKSFYLDDEELADV